MADETKENTEDKTKMTATTSSDDNIFVTDDSTDYTGFDYITSKSEDYLSMSSNELLTKARSQYDVNYDAAIYNAHKFLQSACQHCSSVLDKTTDIIRAKGELLKNGINVFAQTPEPQPEAIGNTALVVPKLTAEEDFKNRYETPMGSESGGSSSGSGGTGSAATLTGSERTEQIYNFLRKDMSLSAIMACGIMGNWQQENNFNTDDNGGGLGIMQWTGSRRANCINMFPNSYTTLEAQLGFFKWEATSGESGEEEYYQAFLNSGATTPEEAAYAFGSNYERPGEPMYENREAYARQFYDMYGSK